jgi:hypothetical protein
MADKKVSQLNQIVGTDVVPASDLLHVIDASVPESKKITITEFLNSIKNLSTISYGNIDQFADKVLLFDVSAGTVVSSTVSDLIEKLRTDTYTYSSGWEPTTSAKGWSSNSNGASKTLTHNLGTTDFQITVMAAVDDDGTDAVWINGLEAALPNRFGARERFGAQIFNITSSDLTVQLGKDGYHKLDSQGDKYQELSWKWIKIICRK